MNNEQTQGFAYNKHLSPSALMARGSPTAGQTGHSFNTTAAVLVGHINLPDLTTVSHQW